jgi:anti-anti-sigma factor
MTLTVLAWTLTTVVRQEGSRTAVVMRGEADSFTLPVVADALSRTFDVGAGDVVVDLAEVGFIDVATVRALSVWRELLAREGRTLTFRCPSRLAGRVLDIFALGDAVEPPPGH